MNFFIKPFKLYMSKYLFYNNFYKIIKPLVFISGVTLYSRFIKYIRNHCNKIKHVSMSDISTEYINNKKKQFLKTYHLINTDLNCNIDKTFYLKEKYKEIIMEPNNRLELTWKTKILLENTPRGNIIMLYDPYKQGFAYYSNSQSIPYDILNSVAMKFVTTYYCRDFFVDDEITPENNTSPFIKLYIQDSNLNKKKEKNTKSHFVKLKQNKKKQNIDTSEKIYNRNKFICLGKINNFSFITPKEIQNSLNGFHSKFLDNLTSETRLQKQVLNYKDFKKQKLN